MVRQLIKYYLFLFCGILLISCSRQQPPKPDQESQFLLMIPKSDVNTKIQLISQRFGQDQAIIIMNESNESIMFKQGFNLKIYSYDYIEQEWVQIQNKVEYISENPLVLVPQKINAENSFQDVTIKPDLEEKDLPITIRVLVTGNLYQNNEMTDYQVSAYTDIKLDESYIP